MTELPSETAMCHRVSSAELKMNKQQRLCAFVTGIKIIVMDRSYGVNDKHEIEIPGLPEGWKPIAYRVPGDGERVLSDDYVVVKANEIRIPCLIVEQIKPRRVVLEETEHKADYGETRFIDIDESTHIKIISDKIWRIVKEGE